MTDPTERPISPDALSRQNEVIAKEQLDEWLDHALEATFPASDPVATPPSSTETDERQR